MSASVSISRQRTLTIKLVLAASVLLWLVFGASASGYHLFQATMLLSYALALVGLNILIGYTGQISLGHGAFYAIGAYGAAILMERFSFPYWAAVGCAGVIGYVAGYLFSFPARRLDGLYLALTTFALGVATPQLIKYRLFSEWTGGVQGIALFKPEAPVGLPLDPDQWLFLFSTLVFLLLIWVARNLLQGDIGRSMRALRDHPLAAEAMGVDVPRIKTTAFAISAAYTAIAGSLSALAVQFVAPDSFGMFLSITLLVGVVVGGLGYLWGAVFGAVFILFVPTLAESISDAAPWTVYGIILIVCMFIMPGGMANYLDKLIRRRGS